MLSCDVIIWDDNTPLFYFSWKLHSLEYFREFSKKFKMAPMEYLEAWGTLIHEKNLKSKISCQTPFKDDITAVLLLGVSFMS
jgi:hypothetical protein